MITAEEIGEVGTFASLPAADRERLARAAADIALTSGEFAAQEGEERALFAVLEGRIEAVKATDGIERVVGERHPGDVFGEVPIVLGTVFPVGFRAAEPTRVMRVDPAAYHSISAVAPEIAQKIGQLAAHRMGGSRGLQGLAADPPPPRAIVVGHRWDPDCAALRAFLDRNQVTYRWIVGESAEDAEALAGPAARRRGLARDPGRRRHHRGATGAAPGRRDARDRDRAGGGCLRRGDHRRRAGRARRGGLRRLGGAAHDRRRARGARRPGRDVVPHRELPRLPVGGLRRRAREPGAAAGAPARRRDPRHPLDHRDRPGGREVQLDGGDVLRRPLDHPRLRRQLAAALDRRLRASCSARAISYGAARSEAPNAHGLDVHIVGAGNSAGQAALLLLDPRAQGDDPLPRRRPREEHVALPDRPARDPLQHRGRLRSGSRRGAWRGVAGGDRPAPDPSADAVRGRVCGGLFIFIGADAETDWLPPEIALRPPGLRADRRGRRRRPGTGRSTATPSCWRPACPAIFACGDVRFGPVKRVAAAVGDGSMSIAFVHQHLREAATEKG